MSIIYVERSQNTVTPTQVVTDKFRKGERLFAPTLNAIAKNATHINCVGFHSHNFANGQSYLSIGITDSTGAAISTNSNDVTHHKLEVF